MIFRNPSGAPELACDECSCRWFDRQHDCCYECGAAVAEASRREFAEALAAHAAAVPLPGRPEPDGSAVAS